MADLGTHTPLRVNMYHGDCLKVMPTLAPGSVAMCFADLPYDLTDCHWDKAIDLAIMWRHFNALLLANGCTVMTAINPFTSHLVISNIKHYRHDLIWNKKRCAGFFNARRAPLREHESIVVFSRNAYTYNPQMLPGKRYTVTTKQHTSEVYNKCGYKSDNRHNGQMRFPRTILKVEENCLRRDSLNGHISKLILPTQKPVALLGWLIKTYSNVGDTILDPVSGSATTAIAAIRNGRHCIAIEKDATYFAAGVERVKAEIAASGVNVDLRIHTQGHLPA